MAKASSSLTQPSPHKTAWNLGGKSWAYHKHHALLGLVFLLAVWGTLLAGFGGPVPIDFTRWLSPNQAKDNSSTARQAFFRWSDIPPSTSLNYTPCFASFQCARLSVPLNWNASQEDRDAGRRVAIAVIKLPAKVPVTDPRYGGPIIVNPGGPGESGVFQALVDGANLQTIVDAPSAPDTPNPQDLQDVKYFDILSFDPRGVNNSQPSLRCFPDAFSQQAWLLRYPDYGLLWDSESIVGMEWARATALGASCLKPEAGGEMLRYVNTAQVVQDMVEIIEKEGEWRSREVERLLQLQTSSDTSTVISKDETAEIVRRTAYHPGEEKLQYWGMSYGTVIGSTFTAMHPDKICRVVLDGVVDPADHFSGGWLTQLEGSDMVISKFCEYCHQAGPDKCSLFTGNSAADIETRFTSIMMSLKSEPMAVLPNSIKGLNAGPEVVTYGDLHLLLLGAMYFSFATAEQFFGLVSALENRNATSSAATSIAAAKQATLVPAECARDGPLDGCVPYIAMMGPNQAISCMDAGGSTNLTRESFAEYLVILKAQGRWISPSWARNKLACLGSTVQTAWRPSWTFEKQQWDNTSYPLLIVGNTHDTVTPLRNAQRVSTLFPGSVVLEQNSEGHCSHSNPSTCTGKAIRAYFQSGQLPKKGDICEPEIRPFLGCVATGEPDCTFPKSEDETLWRTMVDLADPYGLRTQEAGDEAYSRLWQVHQRSIGYKQLK